MREVLITKYCDPCGVHGDHEPAVGTYSLAIIEGERPTGTPRYLDVCERHGKEFADLAELLTERGVSLDKPSPAVMTPARGGQWHPCPIPGCGRELATKIAIRDHLRNVHSTSLRALSGKPQAQATCTECGFVAANGTGLSAHQRSIHREPEAEPEPEPEPPLTAPQARERAGVSKGVLDAAIRRNHLPHTRVDGRTMIAPADLDAWIASRE